MIPSHATKSGLRYGYYQSWALNQGQKEKAGVVARVPAQEIEDAVRAAILESTRSINHDTPPEPADDTWAKCIERIDVFAG